VSFFLLSEAVIGETTVLGETRLSDFKSDAEVSLLFGADSTGSLTLARLEDESSHPSVGTGDKALESVALA